MFKFPETVDSIDSVPESHRGLYQEKDGKYFLIDAAKPLVQSYLGVSDSLLKTEGLKKTAMDESIAERKKRQAYESIGKVLGLEDVTPEVFETKINELVSENKKGGEIKIDMDKIKLDYNRRFEEAKTTHEQEKTQMRGTLERYLIDQAATAALASNKGNVTLLLPHIKAKAKVVQDGDDYVVRVVDAQGDVRPNGSGGFMSVEDLVGEMKTSKDFAAAFESDSKGGSGTPPNKRPNTNVNIKDLSPTQKIAQGLSKKQYTRGA